MSRLTCAVLCAGAVVVLAAVGPRSVRLIGRTLAEGWGTARPVEAPDGGGGLAGLPAEVALPDAQG